MLGSPPGLPGGGITGMLPPCGVGALISGSTPGGGQMTPSERASCSLNDLPVVSAPLRLVVLSDGEALLRAGFRVARFLGHYFGRRLGQWRSLNGLRKRKSRHQRGPKQQRDPQFRQII